MRDFSSISSLPRTPAVYALESGISRHKYNVYVGIAGSLRDRVRQHLILQDSSITTGQSAATLNIAHISSIRWWEHPNFSDRAHLEAAEQIAFDILNPTLRSRGRHSGGLMACLSRMTCEINTNFYLRGSQLVT